MRPGAYPFTELEAALARAVDEPPVTISLLWNHDSDLLRAVLGILPDDGSRLLLVIDQFEELFTLVDDEQRDRFLRGLIALATDPRGRSRVLVTLRADFYDRPLMHPAFGRLMTGHVVNVMPLAADELESAALGPASGVGVTFERGLLAALIDEVSGQPNALPLFQYTLTELFDHREDSMLTRAAYEELGGIRGAVASRAEAIYQGLDRRAARGGPPVVPAAGHRRPRLRDPPRRGGLGTDHPRRRHRHHARGGRGVRDESAAGPRPRRRFGALTLEVAHEALLSEWERLRRWIDDGRDDLRQHAAYTLAVDDWLTAGRDPDYLLAGGRLEQFEQWRATTTMRLTASEREFLDDALRRRDEADAAEIERVAEQARLRRRARRRAFALGAAVAAIATGAIVAVIAAAGTERTAADRRRHLERLRRWRAGHAVRARLRPGRARLRPGRRATRSCDRTVVSDLAASDNDLVILDSDAARTIAPDDLDPSTRYVFTDYEGAKFDGLPNVTSHQWANEQAGFLAGVAAATTTETGTVGFLGAGPTGGGQEEYRAGFEAGVESIDPEHHDPRRVPHGLRVPADQTTHRRGLERWPVGCTRPEPT